MCEYCVSENTTCEIRSLNGTKVMCQSCYDRLVSYPRLCLSCGHVSDSSYDVHLVDLYRQVTIKVCSRVCQTKFRQEEKTSDQPKSIHHQIVCECCRQPLDQFILCKCGKAAYCNTVCQDRNQEFHSKQCCAQLMGLQLTTV